MTQETKPENPPAYPASVGPQDYLQDGMTLLDYFAGQAISGLLANMYSGGNGLSCEYLAECAGEIAAAMLKEREKHL